MPTADYDRHRGQSSIRLPGRPSDWNDRTGLTSYILAQYAVLAEQIDIMTIRCDICTATIPPDMATCPVCGIPREDENHTVGPSESESGPWTIVRTVSTVIEAELMAGRLRNEGVPAIVLSQVDSTRNLTVGGLAIARVYVRGRDHAEADRILSTDADFDFDTDDFSNDFEE